MVIAMAGIHADILCSCYSRIIPVPIVIIVFTFPIDSASVSRTEFGAGYTQPQTIFKECLKRLLQLQQQK